MKRIIALIGVFMCVSLYSADASNVAGKQIEFCMIGDSITWADEGDWFRKHLIERMPNLAFVGTHTAKHGYSHAGEGGNSTPHILKRIDNKDNIPDSRYYHLLVGVNDSAACRKDADVERVSRGTADRIKQIISKLLERPTTELVFWGTILPCATGDPAKKNPELEERFVYRDKAASATNVILRKEIPEAFGNRVVIIEYEKPLRKLENWQSIIRLHPTVDGYKIVSGITAEYIAKYAKPANKKLAKYGVEVNNLWNKEEKATSPLIPGWYIVSFDVVDVDGAEAVFTVQSKNKEKYKTPFSKKYKLAAKKGERVQFELFTAYEGYGYNQSNLEFADSNCKIKNVMFEKMRPSKKASKYGTGRFVDRESPISLGELIIEK